MWQRGEVRREKLAVEEPSSSVPLEMWPGCKKVVCRVSLPCLSRLGTRPNAIHSIALVHYWAMGVKGAPGGLWCPLQADRRESAMQTTQHLAPPNAPLEFSPAPPSPLPAPAPWLIFPSPGRLLPVWEPRVPSASPSFQAFGSSHLLSDLALSDHLASQLTPWLFLEVCQQVPSWGVAVQKDEGSDGVSWPMEHWGPRQCPEHPHLQSGSMGRYFCLSRDFAHRGRQTWLRKSGARPTPDRRDQTKRHNLPGTCQDPGHRAEFGKTEKAPQEWPPLSQVGQGTDSLWFRGMLAPRPSSRYQSFTSPTVYICQAQCATPQWHWGYWTQLCKGWWAQETCRGGWHTGHPSSGSHGPAQTPRTALWLGRNELLGGGPVRATEPPVEPRTECHRRLSDKCAFLGIGYCKKMKAYFATNSFKQKWSLSK